MKPRASIATKVVGVISAGLFLLLCQFLAAQASSTKSQPEIASHPSNPLVESAAGARDSQDGPQAEAELQKGTELTRRGEFTAAIPHLLTARDRVSNQYAASVNLAICYIGTQQYPLAIAVLRNVEHTGQNSNVENLLAQAYVGNGEDREALDSLEKAAALTPQDEKLYLFVADACAERQNFALGVKVVDMGLRNLPNSARLHYERGVSLSQLDRLDRAKIDFSRASELGQGTEIGYLSGSRLALLEGHIAEAVRLAREGIQKGFQSPVLLTTLGEALLGSGIAPGEAEFNEAQSALEKAVAQRPNDPASQIALGQLCLLAGNLDEAITHLLRAQQIMPDQPSIYASLAKAYRRRGDLAQAQQALAALERLNLARAEQIRSAPGERKMSYGGGEVGERPQQPKP